MIILLLAIILFLPGFFFFHNLKALRNEVAVSEKIKYVILLLVGGADIAVVIQLVTINTSPQTGLFLGSIVMAASFYILFSHQISKEAFNMNNSESIYYNESISEQSSDTLSEKTVLEYSKCDILLSVTCALASFGFIRFILWNTMGFISTALYLLIITAVLLYLKHRGHKFSKLNIAAFAVLYLFSFVFSITANELIKTLDAVFLFIGGSYLVFSVANDKHDIERFLPFAAAKAVFSIPFTTFSSQIVISKDAASRSKSGNNIKLMLIGLLVTVPLTWGVGALLMSADQGFENMFSGFSIWIKHLDIGVFIFQLCLALPCSMYLFNLLYNSSHRNDVVRLDQQKCTYKVLSMRHIPNILLYTAITPICILYILFFIAQANYFLSAFSGSLPDGYSYSEYARRGFFELFWVSMINLTVIIVMSLLAKKGGEKKPAAMKAYTTTLSLFTIILIATALSKMMMYINEYGLTQLRVYTSWFMVLLAMVFVMIIIKQFRFSFHIARWLTAVFTVMFALLCFSRPDALIADYNISMYNSGKLEELDTISLLEMSDDAVLEVVKMGAFDPAQLKKEKEEEYDKSFYNKLNISSAALADILDSTPAPPSMYINSDK